MSAETPSRIYGSLLGLAIGDAIGLPADFHRAIRDPWLRSRMWDASADLDRSQVSRPLIPFVLSSTTAPRLMPTDDTETAILAIRVFQDMQEHDLDHLFIGWSLHALREDVWCGVAERSAIINAKRGLIPPQTGSDNPADFSDSAVPAGLAIGLIFSGDPLAAATYTNRWASITHANDGIWAARSAAIATSMLTAGASVNEALCAAEDSVPAGSWLATNLAKAAELDLSEPFNALPDLLESISPRHYSHGGAAAETLPVAFALLRASEKHPGMALPLSTTVARQSDSLPAFVGALVGARHGAEIFGQKWSTTLDTIEGVLYPSLAGESIRHIANSLKHP